MSVIGGVISLWRRFTALFVGRRRGSKKQPPRLKWFRKTVSSHFGRHARIRRPGRSCLRHGAPAGEPPRSLVPCAPHYQQRRKSSSPIASSPSSKETGADTISFYQSRDR